MDPNSIMENGEPIIDIWADLKGGMAALDPYVGKWVAIKNGEVIASAKTGREILRLIDHTEEGAPMVHFVRPPGAFIG